MATNAHTRGHELTHHGSGFFGPSVVHTTVMTTLTGGDMSAVSVFHSDTITSDDVTRIVGLYADEWDRHVRLGWCRPYGLYTSPTGSLAVRVVGPFPDLSFHVIDLDRGIAPEETPALFAEALAGQLKEVV